MSTLKLFEYQHKQVRTIVIDGEVWFVARDVCQVLEIANHRDAVSRLGDKMKQVVGISDPNGREQKTTIINESGIYKLAFRSKKPEAERFTNWVAEEVLPSIRKSGRYEIPPDRGVLALPEHTDVETQKAMSKRVNAFNYRRGGKTAIVKWNVKNCRTITGKTPKQVIAYGKANNLKSKDTASSKTVMRVLIPQKACCMSLGDNLVEQGFDQDKVLEVTPKAEEVFRGMLWLGATPPELLKK